MAHAASDIFLATGGVQRHDRTTLRMGALPLLALRHAKRIGHPLMERLPRPLHPVGRTTTGGAGKTRVGRHAQQQGEIGYQPPGRQRVGLTHSAFGKLPPAALIGIGREKKPVGDHHRAAIERGANDALHQLRSGSHEQQRFGRRRHFPLIGQQDGANPLAQRGSTRLANQTAVARRREVAKEPAGLGRLSRAFHPFEYEKPAASHRLIIPAL